MKNLFRFVPVGAILLLAVGAVPAVAQDAAKPPAVTHDLEGRDQCTMCHSGAMPDVPAAPAETHKALEVNTCLWCHAADAAMQTKTPKTIPHDLEGREMCTMCHSGAMPDVPAAPADHKGREDNNCQMCHKPA
jgi:hypothetical protein